MPSTAYCLYEVSKICLTLWDEAAEHSGPSPYADLWPSPQPPAMSHSATEHKAFMAPIEQMIKAKDLKPGQLTGLNPGDARNDRGFLYKESCPVDCNSHHGYELYWGSRRYKTYYAMYRPEPREEGRGAGNKMPQHLRHDLQRALSNLYMCDDAVFLLLPTVRKLVEQIDPSAEVIHLAVVPRRRIQLFSSESPGPPAHVHAVIFVRSSLAGNFVLDPTAEQYGHAPQHRFLPWRHYKRLYILTKKKWVGTETWYAGPGLEQDLSNDPHGEQYLHDMQKTMGICINSWLRGMVKGGLSLRQTLVDEVKSQQQTEELRREINYRM